ncbi:Cna B-type domain-containing protein [Bacillus niameyensis]|uniref:Cna B-type domain-containing protein n=1 Tax=Bacillus niameyensis TaxID=1522308 RepID=UPI000782BB90|nr:Cna B-type domain-containing protein [Bacillus niameyensis]
MRKKISLLFITLLILQTISNGYISALQISAEEREPNVFTNITITDAGEESSAVDVHVEWSLKDVDVEVGKNYELPIPEEISIQQEQTGILLDGENEIGEYKASTDGFISVSFIENAEEHPEASGNFVIQAEQVIQEISEEETDQFETLEEDTERDNAVEQQEEEKATDNQESEEKITDSAENEQAKVSEDKEKESVGVEKEVEKEENTVLDNEIVDQVTTKEKHGFILELDKITDLNGEPFTEDSLLDPKDEFYLKLDWHLKNGHNYKTGDIEIFSLPKGIKIIEEMTGELEDPSGEVVATYKITTDKKVELTFTNFVETHSNVNGWLQIISKLDEENVEVEDGEAIIDPIGEEGNIRIPIEQGNKEKTIEKKGTPNKGYNADEIRWEVIINKLKTSLTNAKVTDTLPAGTEYKEGSLKVIKLRVDLYGNVLGDGEEVDVTGETVVDGELIIPLGDIKDAYRIEYVTTVTDDDKKEFTNKAVFSDDELEDVEANSKVTINRGEAIKKKAAKSYNPKTGIIEWEIEFNYNQKSLTDVILKDAWTPKGKMEFVEESLLFQEVTINEDGQAHPTGEAVKLPAGAELVKGEDQFEVTSITTDKAYKVTYQTKVKDRVLDGFNIANTAGFGNVSTGSGANVGTYYGSKSAGTIDYKNKTIDWKIEINHDEYPMENISITDTLGNGLTLKKDTINITVDGKKHEDYTLSGDNPFKIDFPANFTTDKKIVITYKTDYVADEVPNHRPKNKAAITWTPEGGNGPITKEVEAGTELNENTKNNDWKNGSYNPATKEITWTIYTNYRENQIDNLIVKDAPQGNQKIIKDSVVVTELAIAANGNITEGQTLSSSVASIDENANTLQVNIGNTNKAYKIAYKTSLADLSDIQKEYVNKAEVLDGSQKISDLHAKVGIAKSDTYGEKSGYQDGKQVHWSVKVNLGQQKISNLKLEDTISANQEYLIDTIKVYEASVDRNGNATKGKEVDPDNYKLTYTPGDLVFTIEWKNEVERAFIVEYSTLFFEKHNGEVTNTYKITGDNIIKDGKTDGDGTVTIKQLSSGGGSGEAGYLVIDKVDVTYGRDEAKLEGAVFDLIDPESGKVLKTGTTDENGHIDFGRLLFGEYELHERIVPYGYVTLEERQTIVIDKKYEFNDESKTTHRIENFEPVFAVELTKTDDKDNGILLDGAQFTLFDSEGKEVGSGTTENGKVVFEDLKHAGTYYVQETQAPKYYKLDETEHKVIIGEKEKVPVKISVKNSLNPGKGKLEKVDADNPNTGLEQAVFDVFDEKGSKVDTITTNASGVATTKELPPGKYTVQEKKPPNGFKESTTIYELMIPKADDVLEYNIGEDEGIIKNEVKRTNIVLTKNDSINKKQFLAGAEFELKYESGDYTHPTTTGTTGADGKVTFENLKPGTYQIIETKAPEGYIHIQDSEPIIVEVTLDNVQKGTDITLNISNDPLAEVIVEKRDSETNVALEGAEFKVTNETTGDPVLTGLKTDANGQIRITGLLPGKYELEETKAPQGYKLDSTSQSFEVIEGVDTTERITKTFLNEIIKGSVELVKVDGDNDAPLEGVEFTLMANSLINGGTYTETTHTTNAKGEISVDNLRPGSYVFTETGTLDKYQTHWKDIEFTINLQNEKHEVKIGEIVNYKLVDIDVTKNWNDNNDDAGLRPENVEIELYRQVENGQKEYVKTKEISGTGKQWKYTFTGLDAVDSNGKKYEYTVKEKQVEGYQQESQTGNQKDGFVLTNVLTTSIDVHKVWKDEKESDRPDKITVELYRTVDDNKELVETKTINSSDHWKHTFTNLPVYDKAGNAYEYYIKEKDIDKKYKLEGIVRDGNSFTITNVRTGETKIEVEKAWLDEGEASRPEAGIVVELYRNNDADKPLKTETIKADSDWKHTFENLAAFDEDGKAYTYTVQEQQVAGYTLKDIEKTDKGYKITNVRTGETAVTVEKEWKDNGNETGDRPGEITVELYRNGNHLTDLDTIIKADEKGKWKYTFKNLAEFDSEGKAYTYKVKEKAVKGYTSSNEPTENGYKITNLRTDTIDVIGEKTWVEVDEQYRPDSITVNLLANGEPTGKNIEVTEKDDWKYVFTGLDQFDEEGKEIKYTVKEDKVVGYLSEVDGYNITNRQETIEISGTKTWKDNGGGRPESITVQVMNGETVIKEQEVIADANGDWEYTFTDLVKYDSDGNEIEYTINELPVPGYKTKIDDFDITNIRTDKINVAGKKTWKDTGSEDRPTEITVQLLSNGKEVDRAPVTAETNWMYKFTNLEAYDDNGIAIKYTVAELQIDGYETIINGYDITNVRTGTTKVTGEKTWVEVDEQYRPESITVNLLANGIEIDKVEVSAKTNWKYSFTELAQFDSEGKEIKYTVEEEKVTGYQSEINGFNITNTQETIDISGVKTWKDNNNATIDRPNSITVRVMNGKTVVKEQEVTANDNGDWKYTFTDLAKYDLDGNEIEYTINELPVPGYQTRIDGFDIINTRADVKSIELKKTWLDNDSADRPDSIEVELFRSVTDEEKELVASYTLTGDANWSLEVKNLPAFNEDGKAYTYEVKEKAVEGYETSINGFDITNLRVGKTSVEGTKTWLDDGSIDRPESIIVHLLANGEKTGKTVEVTADSDWKYAFTNLEKYDEQGKEIAYTVDEEAVNGYEKSIAGYDITNLRVGKTEVEVIKLWKDENEIDRPDTITVNLLQNGAFYKEYEITKENDWKLIITDLPKYDETGKAYEYTVKEHDVPGYVSKVNGFKITNTRTNLKSIEISKTWLDDNAANRPDSIEVELFRSIADDKKELVDTIRISKADGWVFEVVDIPAFDPDGKAYTYEVQEKAVKGYNTSINGFDITNVRVGKTSVEGTKTWKDDNSKDRPEVIKVNLLQNGEVINTREVTAESDWKYSFKDLEKYDENGVAYEYTVNEEAVKGYESLVEGFNITNLRIGKTSVEGTKTWKDDNSNDRPESIKVNLLQNDVVIDTVEVTAKDDWKYSFIDLEKYDENGVAYHYTVKEHGVPGYKSEVQGFDITNTRSEKTSVEVTKGWLDDNAEDRPHSIQVHLVQNGKAVKTAEVKAENDWKYIFADLDAYDENGKAYVYSVKEEHVDGYKTVIDGFNITNIRVGKTEVLGKKIWKDDNSEDRPTSITVELLQNGIVVDSKKVTAKDDWKYSFAELEKYDENGVAYTYTVKEKAINGYESTIDGYDITNVRVGKTTVEGTKTWKDDNSQNRPEVIKVHLLQNGAIFKTQEVTSATDWQYRFAGLDQYDENGVAYKYTVKEEPIKGYESTVDGYDITNLRVGQTAVEGTKTWKDDNSQDRPEVIKVHLLQNGEVIETEEVTAATDWKYSFSGLAKYDKNGVAYKYTVKEEPIKGYESTVDGYDITNVRVGKTSVEGTKTWKDDHSNDRPESIKVNLLQNGVVIDTVEVTTKDDWKYSFKDLAKYDENGVAYQYTVKEHGVPGYKSEIHGFDITNTRTDKTSVEVTKGWLDDNAEDRPASIQVHLLQNGEVIQTVVMKAENDWKHEFTDLDAYDENGRAYTYTVEEEAVAGYKTKVDGYDITNLRIGKTEVTGSKIWKDDESSDRPASITVNLLQNGKVVDSTEVTAESNWQYSFTELAKYDENGVEYKYAVQEMEVVGYETTIDGFDITNVRVGQTEVSGSKTWKDDEPQDRPDFIVVELLQNGKVIVTKEVTASDEWTYHFSNLEKFDENGKEYTYTINEQAVTGYEMTIDGYDITNKLIFGTVELTKYNENGEVLEGAVFELQDHAGNILQTGLTTDQAGKLIVSNLKPGDYQFVEVKAPSGYELDQTPILFTIEKGQAEVTKVKAVNHKTPESPKPERPEPNKPEPNRPEPNKPESNKPGSTIGNGKDPSTTPKDPNHELPNTATNYYNKMLLGVGLLIIGLSLFLFYRRRRAE